MGVEAGARARAVGGGGSGDWVCSSRDCSNLNFSFRRECKRCGKAKWEAQAGWRCAVCACDNHARREECGRCQQPRSIAELDNTAGPSGAAASADGATWQCAACFNDNSSQRTECQVCKHPRPHPRPSTATTANSEHGPGPPPQPASTSAPGGDWRCTICAFNNYARRAECHRCQAPRGVAAEHARTGLWKCPNPYCAFDNYPYRRECHRCRTPQPPVAAAPSSMMYGAGAGHWQGQDMSMAQAGMMQDVTGTITPEVVLEQLMADGTFDSLRSTVTSLLKSNVHLQRFTTESVLNSNVLRHQNRKELESMTREELFAKLRRELEVPVMRCASKHVWDILMKPDQGPVADQIEEAVYRAAGLRRTSQHGTSNASTPVPSMPSALANGHDMGHYSPVSPGIGDGTPDLAKVEEKVNEAVAEAAPESLRANMVTGNSPVSLDAYADIETPMES
eukprot:jgi/Chlat1/6626/Chrsp482S06110